MSFDDLRADFFSDLCPVCLEDGENVPNDLLCDDCGAYFCTACVAPNQHGCEGGSE